MPIKLNASSDALSIAAYPGDGSVLLAFNVSDDFVKSHDLAGFAIHCKPPQGDDFFLQNRLNFASKLNAKTTPKQRLKEWTSSDEAPFQKFHWTHFPTNVVEGEYTYTVTVKNFKPDGSLEDGPSASVTFELWRPDAKTQIGFTRGYLSSQAYAEKFHNAPIRPAGSSVTYDETKFAAQYSWLGAHAGKLIFNFLTQAEANGSALDVLAYDCDEPEFIATIVQIAGKSKVRVLLDNAPLHTKSTAREVLTAKIFANAGVELVRGHFSRFAHCKVLIEKDKQGKPIRVLTGSANFSVRGLYVQANNVLLFDSPDVATRYEEAFENAFTNKASTAKFAKATIAGKYFPIEGVGLTNANVAFSPHSTPKVSLDRVNQALKNAKSSVLFAVMELGGSGPVLNTLLNIHKDPKVFSFGMTQTAKGVSVFKPQDEKGYLVPFSYLSDKVPAPFKKEFSGGAGQVIHHKFIVIDFNTENPVVFTGSSNLAEGGEKANGDNLIEIHDRDIVSAYAVEAIRLVDHYQFRAALKKATKADPLSLQTPKTVKKAKWWEPFYDKKDVRFRERVTFVITPKAKAVGR